MGWQRLELQRLPSGERVVRTVDVADAAPVEGVVVADAAPVEGVVLSGPADAEVDVEVEVEGGIDAAPANTSEAPVGGGGRYEGAALVDQRVRVLWSGDGPHAWYAGVVTW